MAATKPTAPAWVRCSPALVCRLPRHADNVCGNGRIANQKVDGQAPQRLEAAGLRRFRVPAARGLVIVLALGFAAQRDVCTCV